MSALGHFLEFSVHTPDIPDSLGFYKRLGFSDQQIGDIWPHKYAVVSDGNVCIGLHEREFRGPALTFVHPDLAQCARSDNVELANFFVSRPAGEHAGERRPLSLPMSQNSAPCCRGT